jgi:hypothetical protein
MIVLGALVYLKLSLLSRELVRLVHRTHDSIENLENLNTVQRKMSHAENLWLSGG